MKNRSNYRELEQKIFSTFKENMFSNILGPQCSYVFSKLTLEHDNPRFALQNIFSEAKSEKSAIEFLKNPLYDISCDTEFIQWMETAGFLL